MQGDLPLLFAGETFVGDEGQEEFGRHLHAAMMGAAVTQASSRDA